ncbi:MAG: hypothetical protein PHO32_03475, partial [Candidatus Cloacimonetes bacterium]|nr:hypothetical protein [Candidatus Cloacimonadota bacterium]
AESITSLFWNILDPLKPADKITADKREKLKSALFAELNDCLLVGFQMGKKSIDRLRLRNITRADLYTKAKEESND